MNPDSMPAAVNSPALRSDTKCADTDPAPADSPHTNSVDALPPNLRNTTHATREVPHLAQRRG